LVRSQAFALTRSLDALRHDLVAIVRAGIAAVDAARLVERAASPSSNAVPDGSLRVIAAGKAAVPMARAAHGLFGSRIRAGLIVGVVPAGGESAESIPFEMVIGGHPMPTAESERGGRRALEIAASLQPGETLLVFLSGGASALMAVPGEGLTLADKQATTRHLLRAGADIHELNTVRKHLSAIKGGWLAAGARGACRTFAISDVVGDDLSVIGSGPTVPDASTFHDALDVLRRFAGEGGDDVYPRAVIDRVIRGIRGDAPETPKPHDPRLSHASTTVIGGRRHAMDGAAGEAVSRGYHVIKIDDAVVGDARLAAPSHLRAALARAADAARPACIISSGETTVRVTGDGLGGRNQEFALACAGALASLGVPAAAASIGTDGIDGPTDAAGAVVDSTTFERAQAARLRPESFLERNDTYHFFETLGDLIHTGPTGTNVGDLQAILLA
jgi:glycerate 2-kinase